MRNLGFIGAGNMAQAIFRRLLARGVFEPGELSVSDVQAELTQRLHAELGVTVAESNVELVRRADVVVLAVKPVFCAGVLREIREALGTTKPLLSIVSGWTPDMLAAELAAGARLLRVMPNTPAMVGEGMTLFDQAHTLDEDALTFAQRVFGGVGNVLMLEARLFDAATCVSGCGPAFLYQIIEALGDAGVMRGLPRAMAYQLAAQTMVGAGRMVLESGRHPGELKDAVCSPGGTTITGVYELERAGVRAAMIDAVNAAFFKGQQVTEAMKSK